MHEPKSKIGFWSILPSIELASIGLSCGFDFIILDMEHGLHGLDTVFAIAEACRSCPTEVFVRIPVNDWSLVQRLSDIGVAGILFPKLHAINDIQKAKRLLTAEPKGDLGFNPFVRAYQYGASINRKLPMCIGMIEDLDLLTDSYRLYLEEGIDAFYLGSYDMNHKAGYDGDMRNNKFQVQLAKLFHECTNRKSHRLPAFGMKLPAPEFPFLCQQELELDFDYRCLFVDSGNIKSTWMEMLNFKLGPMQ